MERLRKNSKKSRNFEEFKNEFLENRPWSLDTIFPWFNKNSKNSHPSSPCSSFRCQHISPGIVHSRPNTLPGDHHQIRPLHPKNPAKYSKKIRFADVATLWDIHHSSGQFAYIDFGSQSLAVLRIGQCGHIRTMFVSIFLVSVPP